LFDFFGSPSFWRRRWNYDLFGVERGFFGVVLVAAKIKINCRAGDRRSNVAAVQIIEDVPFADLTFLEGDLDVGAGDSMARQQCGVGSS